MTRSTHQRGSAARRLRRGAVTGCAAGLALVLIAAPAQASDTLPWTGDSAVGATQPYQHGYTTPDVLDWDPSQDRYAEMLRARVPLQPRNAADATTQLDPSLPAQTQMLTLAGDYGNSFFESHQGTDEFSQYLFNYWQYSDVYASWHGQPVEGVPVDFYDPAAEWTQKWFEFGMLNLPNPAYTNAAHANGVKSIATIFFSVNDRSDQTYEELLVRDADGGFPVVAKLVEIAGYFGFDGYFVNQEETRGVAPEDIDDYKDFLKALRDAGMYVQWYDSTHAETGALGYQNEFNETGSPFVQDAERGRVSDSMFLNYWWNNQRLTSSKLHAESLGLDPREAVFAGVEAGMYQFEQPYDLQQNLGADGTPMNAIATLGADFVHSDYKDKTDDAKQWETFDRERRWWTGSSTGTGEPENSWRGISSYIAERSVIGGSTFSTDFNTGHGLDYWAAGKLSSEQEWGDINLQDTPPTWQWWVDSESATPLTADFDYGPSYVSADRFDYTSVGAYQGGSSLVLSGDLDADTTLRLFKTDLDVQKHATARITYQKPTTDDSELRLAVVLASNPDEVVELPVPRSGKTTKGWKTAEVDLRSLRGEKIVTLGLTVGAGKAAIADYQVNVGELDIVDRRPSKPSKPSGFAIDEYLPGSDEMFVSWDLDPYEEVRRYEVYLDDEFLAGGYDEVKYLKNVPERKGDLELVAVGHDGGRSTAAKVRFDPTRAPSSVTAVAGDDGSVAVSWEGSGRDRADVTLTSLSGEPFERSVRTERGATSALLTGLPTDGSEFTVEVATDKRTAAAVRSTFADTELSPYPASSARFDGDTMTLTRPTPDDWHTLTVYENGTALEFDTTYNQGTRPYWIRGRTTLAALTVELQAGSRVTAVLKDYAGNERETVLREAAPPATAPTPTAPAPESTGAESTSPESVDAERDRPLDAQPTPVPTASVPAPDGAGMEGSGTR